MGGNNILTQLFPISKRHYFLCLSQNLVSVKGGSGNSLFRQLDFRQDCVGSFCLGIGILECSKFFTGTVYLFQMHHAKSTHFLKGFLTMFFQQYKGNLFHRYNHSDTSLSAFCAARSRFFLEILPRTTAATCWSPK